MHKFALMLAGLALAAAAHAQPFTYPPNLPGAKVEVYKTIGDTQLKLWIYSPPGARSGEKRPAAVFFFGGAWTNGSPAQFAHQCEYLAGRGMVAITADYRVQSRHGAKVAECVEDAKSAIRYVRTHAVRLGIDPERIAAGGGSAGGHLAAATATVPGFKSAENIKVSSRPNALLLFNPVVILAPVEGMSAEQSGRQGARADRFGADPIVLSPYHHLAAGAPPTIIFHGKADTTVPYTSVEAYCEKMKSQRGRCELAGFEGAGHGFFNYERGGGDAYRETIARMDAFLLSLGWLAPR